MNWLLTLLFWCVMFPSYYITGDFVLNIFGMQCEKRFTTKMISGFLILYTIGFIVGFPAQLFGCGWNLFFVLLMIAYLLFVIVVLFYYKNKINIKSLLTNIDVKTMIIVHIKEYWFIYLMILVFVVLSMANQKPFLYMNYDDHYYIGKILNNINTPVLGNENYYHGALLESGSFSIARIINSYEINYAFFSVLFHIDVPFFCRVSMTVNNYYVIFLSFKAVSELFLQKKVSQFGLIPFVLFFICHAFLNDYMPFGFNIKTYDGWQFQTAMWYGGSIVRCMAIPTLYVFGKNLISKFDIKNFIYMMVLSVAFMAFSTIYLQIVILVFIMFIYVKLLYLMIHDFKDKRRLPFYVGIVLFISICLLVFNKINPLVFFTQETIDYYTGNYPYYRVVYIFSNRMFRYAPLVFIVLFLWADQWEHRLLVLMTLGIYILFRVNYFSNILLTTAFGFMFVTLRTMSSLQYMILLFIGIITVKCISCFKKSYVMSSILSVVAIVFSLSIIVLNYDQIKTLTYRGSGMVKEGYDFKRLFTNDKMIPLVVDEVGAYFDTLPYGNYKLYVQNLLPFEDTVIEAECFSASSTNIENCVLGGCNNVAERQEEIDTMLINGKEFAKVESILKLYEIEYVLTVNETLTASALEEGHEIVLTYEDDFYTYQLIHMMS